MKATGIVRRIDDLGRVVIPKEIRRTLRIREGDPLEIYTDIEEKIVLKKYSPVGEVFSSANQYAAILSKITDTPSIICDCEKIIASSGISKKELLEKINALGIGPQGFGGKTTALCVNIEKYPTHIAGLPVAVNINCHVTRHKTEVI